MGRYEKELENFIAGYRREVSESAGALLGQEMPVLTEGLFALFEQNGNRLQYENVYFGRRKMLAVLGLEAILEKEEAGHKAGAVSAEIMDKLCLVMEDICQEECWALPAHVDRKGDPDWRITVELFACETAQTLSEIADRLKEELPARLRDKVIREVERRVLEPFFDSEVPYRNWECTEMNWNAVCAGSIGSVCLHLMREDAGRLEPALRRVCDGISWYIKGFAEDGVCMEGLGYYTYGMAYFVNFAQELYEYSGGKWDLFCGNWGEFEAGKEDKRTRIAQFPAKCFFPDGRTLSFSDGFSRDTFRVGLLSVLAMHYPGVSFPDLSRGAGLHGDSCYRFVSLKMDMLYTGKYLSLLKKNNRQEKQQEKGQERTNAFYILPSAQWCIGYSKNGAGFACKGGNNNEPHNHNDIGHFLYEAGGVMFLTDLGCGEYTKEYFSDGRYRILCNNSFGHSLPVLDGKGQCAGAVYACQGFEAGADGRVRMEIGKAYAPVHSEVGGTVPEITRELRFGLEDGRLELQDRFEKAGNEVSERLVTQIFPEVSGNHVVLEKDGVKCLLEIQDLDEGGISVKEYSHSNHSGEPEKVYAICWKVKMQDGKGESRVLIFIPAGNESGGRACGGVIDLNIRESFI